MNNKLIVVFATTAVMVFLFCPDDVAGKRTGPLKSTLRKPRQVFTKYVYDINGNILKGAKTYTIIVVNSTEGIGMEQRNEDCPLYFRPHPFENTETGVLRPFRFYDLRGEELIFEGATLGIDAAEGMYMFGCSMSSPYWQVIDDEIRTGGELLKSRFLIKSAATSSSYYKLQYCRRFIPYTHYAVELCEDLGVSVDPVTATPTLVVTALNPLVSPLHFQFKPTP